MSRDVHGKRTKIVATIGPASDNADTLRRMIRAGLDVVRINFSHIAPENYEATAELIKMIRKLATEEAVVVAIMADLQGPKIRLGTFEPDPYPIKRGDEVTITSRENYNIKKGELPMPHPDVIRDVRAGHRLLIDDGEIELRVKKCDGQDLVCEVIVGEELKSRKGVSVPQTSLSLSALTPKDERDVEFALNAGVDYVAMSFVRHADDMRRLRFLVEHMHGRAALVAKIEKAEAITAFDEILEYSDGIMVARGDLGVEIPAAEVPIQQKAIISKCNDAGKPVITATQMLSSMVKNPRPTRAEASDVANAIFDGTDAIMLSNETATGAFPVNAIETMTAIAEISEKHLYETRRQRSGDLQSILGGETMPSAISFAAQQIAKGIEAQLIVSCTWTGYTAQRAARERPATPILCVTPNPETYHKMALVWGVIPVLVPEFGNIDQMLDIVEQAALGGGYANMDDRLVIIGGVPFGAGGNTNFIKVHIIGETSTFRP